MSLGENSLVAAYQGKGQLKSRPSGTRVVTLSLTVTVLSDSSTATDLTVSFNVAIAAAAFERYSQIESNEI